MSVILNALKAKEAARAAQIQRRPNLGVFIADDERPTQKNVGRLAVLIIALFATMIFAGFQLVSLIFSSSTTQSVPQAKMLAAPMVAAVPAVVPSAARTELSMSLENAKALYAQGKADDSLQMLEKMVKANPADALAYTNMGLILMKQDRLISAEAYLREAVKVDTSCAECYNNLGLLATQKGRAVEAERHFIRAMDLDEEYAEPYFNLAVLLEKNGDETGAIAHFEDFLRYNKDKSSAIAQQVKKHIAKLSS